MSETPMTVHNLSKDRPVENKRMVSVERLSPENRSAIEYLLPNSRSMNVHPWASLGTRMPPNNGSNMSVIRNRYPNNHRYDNSDDGVVLDTQKNINRQINHIDYSNLETDNWAIKKERPTDYHDSYDLTYNIADYGSKQSDSIAGIDELNKGPGVELDPYYSTIYGPYNKRPIESKPSMDHQPLSTNYQLQSLNYQPPSTNYNPPRISYEPPKITAPQSPILPDPQQKIELLPLSNKSVVDWRLFTIFSLIKLGIVKLKSIAIIKILLFLLFNLKLLLIILFFKFLLLLKLLKAMILPFLLVPQLLTALTLPMILSTLISIPRRIIRFLTTPNNSSAVPSTSSSLPSNMVPSLPSNMVPSLPSNTRPAGLPSNFVPFVPRPPSETMDPFNRLPGQRPTGIAGPLVPFPGTS
ncbi:uncharacterized protein LOC126549859 [Aphis gossypii]|uniref:uncharacterized protein LOC126549859 n=1 Tax=Aphis gossypii TaxID=80765 RepID=UPI0021597877|nr:uncharacterized protein LOC126549859 [Aphis gossypii]